MNIEGEEASGGGLSIMIHTAMIESPAVEKVIRIIAGYTITRSLGFTIAAGPVPVIFKTPKSWPLARNVVGKDFTVSVPVKFQII